MRYRIIAAACSLLAIASCKKDDDNNTTARPVAEYTMLTPGNYWIYQSFAVDSNGNGMPGSNSGQVFYDSVYVEKDTPINGHTYHKLRKPDYPGSTNYIITWLRDSLNYEVDDRGSIYLAPDDYTSIFAMTTRDATYISGDSVFLYTVRMADRDKAVTVPAGTFTTVSLDYIYNFVPYVAQVRAGAELRQHFRYAKGVGMVLETLPLYYALPLHEERRLLRYKVK